ncbi:hypothetical protein [Mesorhizobium sp.]|uniref:hypothetical protein n=1 Tax=Mesorhizobium sp. TaxID=1871066 RepID=UPI00345B9F70
MRPEAQLCATKSPWSDSITSYDRQHRTIYLCIRDACADNLSVEEMANLVLGIDPILEPVRARKAVRSHIDRANWMVTYRLQATVRRLNCKGSRDAILDEEVPVPPFISARPRTPALRISIALMIARILPLARTRPSPISASAMSRWDARASSEEIRLFQAEPSGRTFLHRDKGY